MNIREETLKIARNLIKKDPSLTDWVISKFPELRENEDEKIRKALISILKSDFEKDTTIYDISVGDIIAWLEKQSNTNETINRDELAKGVLRGAAINLINWIDYNAAEGNMCLSNMECEDIENALVSGDWNKIYAYIKKKLEKQGEQKPADNQFTPEQANVLNGHIDISIKQKPAVYIPKFHVGDKLVSKNNPSLTYEVLEVGHISEFGNPEYKVRIFTSGELQYPRNAHYIECYKVDGWAKLIEPTDKIEPKFKVGDWVVCENAPKFTAFKTGDVVQISNKDTLKMFLMFENYFRLWTLADAKDGDILIDKSGSRECPFIFKETKSSDIKTDVPNPLTVLGYCGIGGAGFTKGSGWGDTANCIYYPVTKEQRDTLIKAMTDAGYIWDSTNKRLLSLKAGLNYTQNPAWSENEKLIKIVIAIFDRYISYIEDDPETAPDVKDFLIKEAEKCIVWFKSVMSISQNHCLQLWHSMAEKLEYPCDIIYVADNENMFIYRYLENGRPNDVSTPSFSNLIGGKWCYCKDIISQKPQTNIEWSDEDYNQIETIACHLDNIGNGAMAESLLNIRDKLYRPQNNITDEELAQAKKNAYNDALDKIEYHNGNPTFDDGWSAAIWYLKKRNVMPQKQWKPLGKHLEALNMAINDEPLDMSVRDDLNELFEQLKQL